MKYPLSRQDYDALIVAQSGLCAICEKDGGKPLVVDHDHLTNDVRGLLCGDCNAGLGFFHEDPVALVNAVHFLGESESVAYSIARPRRELAEICRVLGRPEILGHQSVCFELASLARKYNEEAARILGGLIEHFSRRRSKGSRKTLVRPSPSR